MKSLSVKEIHELAEALVAREHTDEVKALLERFETGEIRLDELLTELRRP